MSVLLVLFVLFVELVLLVPLGLPVGLLELVVLVEAAGAAVGLATVLTDGVAATTAKRDCVNEGSYVATTSQGACQCNRQGNPLPCRTTPASQHEQMGPNRGSQQGCSS